MNFPQTRTHLQNFSPIHAKLTEKQNNIYIETESQTTLLYRRPLTSEIKAVNGMKTWNIDMCKFSIPGYVHIGHPETEI